MLFNFEGSASGYYLVAVSRRIKEPTGINCPGCRGAVEAGSTLLAPVLGHSLRKENTDYDIMTENRIL